MVCSASQHCHGLLMPNEVRKNGTITRIWIRPTNAREYFTVRMFVHWTWNSDGREERDFMLNRLYWNQQALSLGSLKQAKQRVGWNLVRIKTVLLCMNWKVSLLLGLLFPQIVQAASFFFFSLCVKDREKCTSFFPLQPPPRPPEHWQCKTCSDRLTARTRRTPQLSALEASVCPVTSPQQFKGVLR